MDTQPEKRVEYRGFVLEVTKEPKSHRWMLRYRLNGYSPAHAKSFWKTTEEAEAHGKRMIDSLMGSNA